MEYDQYLAPTSKESSDSRRVRQQREAIRDAATDDANVFERVVEADGRLNGVVNAVGKVMLKSAHRTSLEEWDALIGTNLTSQPFPGCPKLSRFQIPRQKACAMERIPISRQLCMESSLMSLSNYRARS